MEGQSLKSWTTLEVVVQGGAIIVTLPSSGFRAVYYKPHRQPQLILRERTKTDDYNLLSEAMEGRKRQGASPWPHAVFHRISVARDCPDQTLKSAELSDLSCSVHAQKRALASQPQ